MFGVDADRVVVVPNGVDAAAGRRAGDRRGRRPAPWPAPTRYVLAVGTVEPRKDLPSLVRRLRPAGRRPTPTCALVIAGPDGWGAEALDRRRRRQPAPRPHRAAGLGRRRPAGRPAARAPRSSPTRRSTRASACRRSRRWRPARPWSTTAAGVAARGGGRRRPARARPATPTRWRRRSTAVLDDAALADDLRRAPGRRRGRPRSLVGRAPPAGPRRPLYRPRSAGPTTRPIVMRALVTGAAGFVGRHLVAHLEAMRRRRRSASIATTDPTCSTPPALARLRRRRARPTPSTTWPAGATWAARGSEPLAAFRANADGTLNLLQACLAAGRPRVLSVSSADVYGRVALASCRIDRGRAAAPGHALRGEQGRGRLPRACRPGSATGSTCCGCGRSTTSGPGQTNRFVAPGLAERIARNELDGTEVVPVGNLTPRRDFTDVRDVVRAYRLLDRARRGRRGLQRLLGRRHRHQRAGRPARRHGRPPDAPRGGPDPAAPGRRARAARRLRPSCTRPPAGSPRSRSSRRSPTCSAEWRHGSGLSRRSRDGQRGRPSHAPSARASATASRSRRS